MFETPTSLANHNTTGVFEPLGEKKTPGHRHQTGLV
jgi:hypothetical protein